MLRWPLSFALLTITSSRYSISYRIVYNLCSQCIVTEEALVQSVNNNKQKTRHNTIKYIVMEMKTVDDV